MTDIEKFDQLPEVIRNAVKSSDVVWDIEFLHDRLNAGHDPKKIAAAVILMSEFQNERNHPVS